MNFDKYAVVIKHIGRDTDYRMDIYQAPEGTPNDTVKAFAESNMIGPFVVIAVTQKINLNAKKIP